MRMALNPAARTLLLSCWVTIGLPHAVSPQMASSVFPRFQPTLIWLATWDADGRVWVCALIAAGTISAARHNGMTSLNNHGNDGVLMKDSSLTKSGTRQWSTTLILLS